MSPSPVLSPKPPVPNACILGIEYTSDFFSGAIRYEGQFVASLQTKISHHNGGLLTEIDALFTQAELPRQSMTGLALTVGPGSFTALRIACAFAQSCRLALNIPVYTALSHQITAMNYTEKMAPGSHLHVITPAYRGEVYHATFCQTDSGFRMISGPTGLKPDALPTVLTRDDVLIGSGIAYAERLAVKEAQQKIACHANRLIAGYPNAENLIRWLQRQSAAPSELILPYYCRKPEAEMNYALQPRSQKPID